MAPDDPPAAAAAAPLASVTLDCVASVMTVLVGITVAIAGEPAEYETEICEGATMLLTTHVPYDAEPVKVTESPSAKFPVAGFSVTV
jgi:hypothetical protein